MVFVHRDTDGAAADDARDQILSAVEPIENCPPVVPVVPAQELEAWLLTDESEIRRVAGNPKGKADLKLPKRKALEKKASPKELLERAYLEASEESGRRRRQIRRGFPRAKIQLLDALDISGPIRELDSFRDLVDAVSETVAKISAGNPHAC